MIKNPRGSSITLLIVFGYLIIQPASITLQKFQYGPRRRFLSAFILPENFYEIDIAWSICHLCRLR